MENEQSDQTGAAVLSPSPARITRTKRIAPLWHTALLLVMIAATSLLGSRGARQGRLGERHLLNYGVTLLCEWALAAFAVWGARMGGTSLRELLGERRVGFEEWWKDIGIAGVFWLIAMLMLALGAALLKAAHLVTAPQNAAKLAPSTAAEVVLWIALSMSAGICEELIFRGYLQQQFTRLSGKLWPGILLSAIFFGSAHGYEGIGGMILITLYGAMFSVLAWKRRSLRAGMIAHAWHDTISGVALALLKQLGKI